MDVLKYTSPDGEVFDFLGEGVKATFLTEAGMSGLVGAAVASTVTVPGRSGQKVTSFSVPPIAGSLVIHLHDPQLLSHEDLRKLRRAFQFRAEGVLEMESEDLELPLKLRVRLNEAISEPESRVVDSTGLTINLSLVSDDGYWFTEHTSADNSVTVTNLGDVSVWVKIRWVGAGGLVTLPSGATFQLPAASTHRILHLDNADSCIITNDAGVKDEKLWINNTIGIFAEGVPVGGSGTFSIPKDATLQWEIGVLDPFS